MNMKGSVSCVIPIKDIYFYHSASVSFHLSDMCLIVTIGEIYLSCWMMKMEWEEVRVYSCTKCDLTA